MLKIFVINPGSTSTKVALYQNDSEIISENLPHSAEEISQYSTILAQYDLRLSAINSFLARHNVIPRVIDAFVARGGLLKPISSGTFAIDSTMLEDLRTNRFGEHASNLGALLAFEIADSVQKPAYIVDPVVVDEMQDLARHSGCPELPRKSIFHALNHKAVARKAAMQLNLQYESCNFIIAHLGGGISIASHKNGKVIDVNNALDGEGPFTPERSGTLPAGDLVRLCFSGKYDLKTIMKMIIGSGGLVAYLGTNDLRRVKLNEDPKAYSIIQAMSYQIAKEIASHGAVLEGRIDAIVLTGGMAFDEWLIDLIKKRIEFLAPVIVIPGEKEMEALALGALRILRKEEVAKSYGTIEK